jgi:hypothetical protein
MKFIKMVMFYILARTQWNELAKINNSKQYPTHTGIDYSDFC